MFWKKDDKEKGVREKLVERLSERKIDEWSYSSKRYDDGCGWCWVRELDAYETKLDDLNVSLSRTRGGGGGCLCDQYWIDVYDESNVKKCVAGKGIKGLFKGIDKQYRKLQESIAKEKEAKDNTYREGKAEEIGKKLEDVLGD